MPSLTYVYQQQPRRKPLEMRNPNQCQLSEKLRRIRALASQKLPTTRKRHHGCALEIAHVVLPCARVVKACSRKSASAIFFTLPAKGSFGAPFNARMFELATVERQKKKKKEKVSELGLMMMIHAFLAFSTCAEIGNPQKTQAGSICPVNHLKAQCFPEGVYRYKE